MMKTDTRWPMPKHHHKTQQTSHTQGPPQNIPASQCQTAEDLPPTPHAPCTSHHCPYPRPKLNEPQEMATTPTGPQPYEQLLMGWIAGGTTMPTPCRHNHHLLPAPQVTTCGVDMGGMVRTMGGQLQGNHHHHSPYPLLLRATAHRVDR
jgi:hypothetical protein